LEVSEEIDAQRLPSEILRLIEEEGRKEGGKEGGEGREKGGRRREGEKE